LSYPFVVKKTPALLKYSGAAFVAANLVAGLCHYFFQVIASKELSAADFSELNAWFANIAIFFMIGGLLQYTANFLPASKTRLRQAIVVINIFYGCLAVAWFMSSPGLTLPRALMVLSGSTVFGWLLGQVQSRLLFFVMAGANLLFGVSKLLFVLLLPWGIERYTFALFACYLPGVLLISVGAWRADPRAEPKRGSLLDWQLWAAPVILSVAGAVIPQLDLVLMDRIQSPPDFQAFARASLYYRGIYFFMFIFAQWLLPQQIRESQMPVSPWYLALAGLGGSAGLALVSPAVTTYILKWSEAPAPLLIFASCLNMSLMTWMFLLIQEACARHRVRAAGAALLVLALEALVQLGLKLPPFGYLFLAIGFQLALIAFLSHANRRRRKNSHV
jgi:hypothetical protein